MEIIFDDSFRFLSNTQRQEDEIPTRISSFGSVILENIRLAVDPRVQSEFNRYKSAIPVDRTSILQALITDTTISAADKEWFQNKIQGMGDGSSGGGWNSKNDDLQGQAIQESNIVGEAGADVGSILKLKEAVLARLRMRGISDTKINDILVLFMEKVMLPPFETIKVLDYLLQESLKARVDAVDLMEFWAYHYNEKRSQGLTKSIIDQAVKLQEINPSINIFNLLKNAAIGNQAEVGKVILIKDPDARLVVNNLISLSQSALPEQSEQVRRDFQFSRDALTNYQEKLRIQKALFDMMKTEEMNRNVSSHIANTSAIFKGLITQPLFRGLRDVFYDLQASKILLNQYSSLITDTQPITPRVTPREEQESPGEGMYQYPNLPQRISSKFVPLKKNSIVIAQTNAVPGSLPTSTNPLTGAQSFAALPQQPQSQGSLGYATAPVSPTEQTAYRPDPIIALGFMKDLKDKLLGALNKIFPGLKFVIEFIIDGILKIVDFIKQGVTNILQFIETIFMEIGDKINGFMKDLVSKGAQAVKEFFGMKGPAPTDPATAEASLGLPDNKQPKKKANTNNNFRIAQYNQQTTTAPGAFSAQKWASGIGAIVTIIVAILGGRAISASIVNLVRAPLNNISEIVNLVLPAALTVKNFIFEFIYDWNPNAGNQAPTSAQYYDRTTRRFSAEGLRRLYNNQQTRVSLGISGNEDLALSRAEKQRSENMATVRTQLEILQKSMDQPVYLGGKTDVAPANIPGDLQNKINEFLKLCKSVQDANQAEYLILKKAIDRVSASFDPVQKIQAQNILSNVRNDMASLQSIIAEYSSSAIVMGHLQRKRKLQMVLGPTLKRLQALEGLGISKAALITGKNGVLAQLSRIRHEEASALQKLRKEYQEKMQLLDNPDIAQKEFAFPVDTKATKLPLPPLPPTAPTSA